MAQTEVWLDPKALRQCCDEARFADTGFARDQHDLAIAPL